MDAYVVAFHLRFGIGVIGSAFYTSLVIWDFIHLLRLLLNREIGLIFYLFDIKHSLDNSNCSNWMFDLSLYDKTRNEGSIGKIIYFYF